MIACVFDNGTRATLRHAVVHAVVERDGALLLVRRAAHLPDGGRWGLPGGFLDRDETLSQGVLRELHEETGWTGRVVEPLAQTGRPDAESSAVAWIPIDRLPALDTLAFDHGDTVRAYLDSRDALLAAPTLI